jgi:type II secretory pathway predicted ATPase ExeA
MSNNYFNLTHNPFDKSVPVKDAFLSADHKSMVDCLNFLKDTGGIGAFTAPSGSGKTFALRCFQESLNRNLYECKYICLSTVSVMEFYRQLCAVLGLDFGSRKSTMFRGIQEHLYYVKKEKRRTMIICLDECQYLSYSVLCDLSMLMNFNYDSFSAFALALAGLPHFNNNLMKPLNEPLRQRIIANYSYSGLSKSETAEYILSRIESAGGARTIIDEAALNAVGGSCRGNPRIINTMMTNALILATQMKKTSIDTDTVLAANNAMALG